MNSLLLCGYSLPHTMGYLPSRDGHLPSQILSREALLDYALLKGLSGVEIGLSPVVPSFNGAKIKTDEAEVNWHELFKRKNAQVVADYGVLTDYTEEENRKAIVDAARAGAKTMRFLFSHLLCGDRRTLSHAGEFAERMTETVRRLREILPFAEEQGVVLAIENHQDLTSDEIMFGLWREVEQHPFFGVTLDTGNALAVAEDPISFADKVAPIVRHVHLKDYTIHFAENGYHLVRCAAGNGCVPFPEIIGIIQEQSPLATFAIEVAAQSTRTIPVLETSWHREFYDEQIYHLPAALRTLWKFGRPAEEPYSTAYERGESSEAILAEEWDCVERSITYFKSLTPDSPVHLESPT